jgi:hypothetical protein
MARVHCMLDTEGYKNIQTHSEYVIFLLFHFNKDCTNVRQCYVISTLPVLLNCDGEEEEEELL